MSEALGANLNAITSLKQRLDNLNNCLRAQRAALGDPAYANSGTQLKKLEKESEVQVRLLREELLIRENLAAVQQQAGNRRGVEAQKKMLAQHVQSHPLCYGSFQKAADPCFVCGAGLRKLRNPLYSERKNVQGKKQRRQERFELIRSARANAAKMPEGDARRKVLKAADDFSHNIDGAEKAVLSRDVYHFTDKEIKREGAPTGYLRGSEHPELLAKYHISKNQLVPPNSNFRAEIYFPDPEVFGADAKPILTFKGTDLTCPDDDIADVLQAGGNVSSYYKQAIELGQLLDKYTNGQFEVTGHSLGGGMASAVGMITGCFSTIFNPAGLHPKTVAPYIKKTLSDQSQISSYVVEDEILNAGQDTANRLGQRMLVSSSQSSRPLLTPSRLASVVVGVQLSSIPSSVGARTTLPAVIGGKKPNIISRHLMKTVIASLEQEKKKDQTFLKKTLPGKGA
jgi:hypothetical protein